MSGYEREDSVATFIARGADVGLDDVGGFVVIGFEVDGTSWMASTRPIIDRCA